MPWFFSRASAGSQKTKSVVRTRAVSCFWSTRNRKQPGFLRLISSSGCPRSLWRKTMAYQAEISRKNPGCFLFLVDQSESMEDPFAGGDNGKKKAEELATILNKLLHNLCI